MAWTELTREQHLRKTECHPSDLTAQDWAVVCSLLPCPNHLGRRRRVELRRVWSAVQYIAAAELPGQPWTLDAADYQTIRHRQRLRGAAAKMGRRAHLPAAWPLPSSGKRLGENHRKRRGLGLNRPYQTLDTPLRKSMKSLKHIELDPKLPWPQDGPTTLRDAQLRAFSIGCAYCENPIASLGAALYYFAQAYE